MPSGAESGSRSRVWFALGGGVLVVGACLFGAIRSIPPSPAIRAPSEIPPERVVAAGPSEWRWRPRATEAERALHGAHTGVSLTATTASCLPDDPLYVQGEGTGDRCALRSHALLALSVVPRFEGAPPRWDGSDFAALLPPSRDAGETDVQDSEARRERLARVRMRSWVDQREASWCSFSVEGSGPRSSLRARCALDRLGLYITRPPRVVRSQSCGVERVESCRSECERDAECGEGVGCGCAASRCRAGQCTACPPRRVCAAPTFTTQAPPWELRVPLGARQDLAASLVARPGAFRTILHFAVTNASREVRPRDGGVEFDSGYRLQIRPLALSVALCGDDCRTSFGRELPLFSAASWQGSYIDTALRCARGVCTSVQQGELADGTGTEGSRRRPNVGRP